MYNKMESKEAEEKNCHYSNIVSGLALSYSRATKSEERIRILSCVANHFTNKDLKAKFHYRYNYLSWIFNILAFLLYKRSFTKNA